MSNRSIVRAKTARTIDEVMDEMADDILAPSDPATLGWPPTLTIELALRTASVKEICESYGLSKADFAALRDNPGFVSELAGYCEMVRKEGVSFKMKARLQAEELLKTSWRIIHDKTAGAQVRADLIKATMKWAGYDNTEKAGGAALGLQINIVM